MNSQVATDFPQYHSLSSLLINPTCVFYGKDRKIKSYNQVPKIIFPALGEEGTIDSMDPSQNVF